MSGLPRKPPKGWAAAYCWASARTIPTTATRITSRILDLQLKPNLRQRVRTESLRRRGRLIGQLRANRRISHTIVQTCPQSGKAAVENAGGGARVNSSDGIVALIDDRGGGVGVSPCAGLQS